MSPLTLCLIILITPFAGMALLASVGRWLPRKGDWLTLLTTGAGLAAASILFLGMFSGSGEIFDYPFTWISLGRGGEGVHSVLPFGILVDNLTRTMLLVVTGVSFFVHLFSVGYMHDDDKYLRYFANLQLFTFSMLGLVMANNFLTLYIFWELVGLSSYLLIGHFFQKKSAAEACMKAFITTRIGDVGMFIGIMIIWKQVGSLDYSTVFAAANPLQAGLDPAAAGTLTGIWKTLAGLGVFFGAMGKSAQFPLHVWLPDAMEGPTPVSAMIHAATMVAAGVYLVGRVFPLFDSTAFVVIAVVGGITAIFAATIALVQDDIKRVLAYSTVSQLGYMMLGLGAGSFTAGLFHMTTHAAFKALLFLGSGSVIYAMHHEQSMSKYGGLRKKVPITFWTFLAATLAICGLPYVTSGFYSKDMIIAKTLEAGLLNFNHAGGTYKVLFVISVLTAGMTTFYMFRLVFLTFYGKPKDHHLYEHAHESPWVMTVPLVGLAVFSIIAGGFSLSGKTWFEKYVNTGSELYAPYFAAESAHGGAGGHAEVAEAGGHGTTEATESAAAVQHESTEAAAMSGGEAAAHGTHVEHAEHVAHWATVVSTAAMFFIGLGIAWAMYIKQWVKAEAVAQRFAPLYKLFWAKWYMDELYAATVLRANRWLFSALGWFDRVVIDGLVNLWGWITKGLSFFSGLTDKIVVDGLVNLVGNRTQMFGYVLSVFQTGRVRQYFLLSVAAVGVFAVMFYTIFL